jgi:hypothetical protein
VKNVSGAVTVLAVVLLAGCFDFGQPLPLSPPPDADSGGSADASDSGGTDAAPSDSGPPICTPMCPVDTTVTGPFDFPTQVETIFLNNCSNGPCHNGGMGGSEYLTMGMVCSSTIGVVAAETMSTTMMPRITAGDAEQSYLFHKVRGTHNCLPPDGPDGGGARMPFGAPCLTPTELGTIRAWINDGASCL